MEVFKVFKQLFHLQEILLLVPKDASLPSPEHVMANDIDYVIELKAASFSWPEVQSHPPEDQLQSNHNGNLVINNGTYKGMNRVFFLSCCGKHEPTLLFAQRLYGYRPMSRLFWVC